MIVIMTATMRRQQRKPLMGLSIPSGSGTLRDTPGRAGGRGDWTAPGRSDPLQPNKQPMEANREDAAAPATRGSYFLAEGWLLVSVGLLWEDQRLQRGLTPHSVSVIGSVGLPAEVGGWGGIGSYLSVFLQKPFFSPPRRGFTTWPLGGESSRRFQTKTYPAHTQLCWIDPISPPLPPQPPASFHLCDGLTYQSAPQSLHPNGHFFFFLKENR